MEKRQKMRSSKLILGALAICSVFGTSVFAGTSNTASLTDIKEAVSLVIKMVEEQKKTYTPLSNSVKAVENSAKDAVKLSDEAISKVEMLKNNERSLSERMDNLEIKIGMLENLIHQKVKQEHTSYRESSSTDEADQTITNFLNSKK